MTTDTGLWLVLAAFIGGLAGSVSGAIVVAAVMLLRTARRQRRED